MNDSDIPMVKAAIEHAKKHPVICWNEDPEVAEDIENAQIAAFIVGAEYAKNNS